jgi:transcriptional regulator with XRE-family HTH domain
MGRLFKGIKSKEMEKIINNLSRNIRHLRDEKKLTTQELASDAKVSISTISEIENARIEDFRMSTIIAIAKVLDASPLSLLENISIKSTKVKNKIDKSLK